MVEEKPPPPTLFKSSTNLRFAQIDERTQYLEGLLSELCPRQNQIKPADKKGDGWGQGTPLKSPPEKYKIIIALHFILCRPKILPGGLSVPFVNLAWLTGLIRMMKMG